MTQDLKGALHTVREILNFYAEPEIYLDDYGHGRPINYRAIKALNLIDQILSAEKDISDWSEIGNERHQTGALENDDALARSGIGLMKDAKEKRAKLLQTITEQTK